MDGHFILPVSSSVVCTKVMQSILLVQFDQSCNFMEKCAHFTRLINYDVAFVSTFLHVLDIFVAMLLKLLRCQIVI